MEPCLLMKNMGAPPLPEGLPEYSRITAEIMEVRLSVGFGFRSSACKGNLYGISSFCKNFVNSDRKSIREIIVKLPTKPDELFNEFLGPRYGEEHGAVLNEM